MTNIIQFPRGHAPKAALAPVPAPVPVKPTPGFNALALLAGLVGGLVRGLVSFVWLVTLMCWPVLNWIAGMDLLFQFVRMIYYWHTPGVYAGWTFLAHFAGLTALTCFVAFYVPKFMRGRRGHRRSHP